VALLEEQNAARVPDLVPVLRRNRNIAVDIADPLGNIGSFRMNHLQAPFNDVKVRRAVLTALNIADELFKEQETEPETRTEQIRQRVEGLIARLDEVLTPS
jgi:ABC-type transport system substrate-binding protein